MSKSFFNYIQPTIIKMSDDADLPDSLKGHFLVNVNAVGIPYFVDNFLLIDNGCGGYMYMLTDDLHKIPLTENKLDKVIDIPRAYIVLTEEFVESQEAFTSWMLSSIADNSFFITGTERFKPGRDYFLNEVLADYLKDKEPLAHARIPLGTHLSLPNYLDGDFRLTRYWNEVDEELARHTNFKFFRLKNSILDLDYEETELDNLLHTFFDVIAKGNMISEDDFAKTQNQIYDKVIGYYVNYETDPALGNIALILNSAYNGVISSASNGCSSCGTSTVKNAPCGNCGDTTDKSCYDTYKEAMLTWMKTMLGDASFYKDWMWIQDLDKEIYPNEGLIDALIKLLENFEDSDYDLSFSGKSVYNHRCDCNAGANNTDAANHKIIQDYIRLLNWVKDGCIDNNVNKIKVIGEKFGDLLSKLNF